MKTMGEICTQEYKRRQMKDYNAAQIRKFTFRISDELKKFPNAVLGDSALCPLKHSFAEGVYVRELTIPKGVIVVGKIHKHSHPNFLLKGEVSVLTEEGAKRIKAPCSMVSKAGTKRVVYAHEDTVWTTIHVTDETDLVKIEQEIIAKDYEQLDDYLISKDKNGGLL